MTIHLYNLYMNIFVKQMKYLYFVGICLLQNNMSILNASITSHT